MALWDIKLPTIAVEKFGVISAIEVLAEFDGPLTFTFRDAAGRLMLANLCAIGAEASRYLATNTTEVAIGDLKSGVTSLYAILIRQPMWLIDVRSDGRVESGWAVSVEDLPANAIPDATALFTDELEAEQLADAKLAQFARSPSDGQIAFDGGPVENHGIDAGFFAKFVQLATELLSEICASIDAPRPLLRLGMTSESSYAVELKVAERSPKEEIATTFFSKPADKDGEAARLRRSFDVLMSLVVDEVPSDEALTLIKRLSLLRQRYGNVLELINRNGATVSVRTRTHPRSRRVSGSEAGGRLRTVLDLGYPFMFLELRGMVIGGQTKKALGKKPSFTILVKVDGKDDLYFSGSVSGEAAELMHLVAFDSEVLAKVKILQDAPGKRQAYELVEIRVVADGSPHYAK